MSALESLIRLHRWQLDEQRRRVASLEELAQKLRAELQRLADEQAAEQQAAAQGSREASFAYGSYAGAAGGRRRRLTHARAETDLQIGRAREPLAESFQEVNRYEMAPAKRLLNQRIQAD